MTSLYKLKSFFLAGGIPGILLLIHPLLIVMIARGRDLDNASVIDSSAVIQIVFTGLVAFYLVNRYLKGYLPRIKQVLFRTPLIFFTLYTLLSVLSTFWSSNPTLTFYRSFECLTFLILIISCIDQLMINYEFEEVLKWVIFFAFWNLFVDILFNIKIRGIVNTFSIPFLPSRLFFTLFFFIIMYLSKSTTTKLGTIAIIIIGFSNKIFIGIALGSIALLFGNAYQKVLFLLIASVAILITLSIGFENLLLDTLFYGRESVGLEDASGRKQVWTYLIQKGLEQPFFGYGFVAGETNLLANSNFNAINAHNSLLSAFLGTGFFGAFLIILTFINSVRIAIRNVFNSTLKSTMLSSLILVLIVSLSGPGLGSRVYGAWIPSVFIIVYIIYIDLRSKKLD